MKGNAMKDRNRRADRLANRRMEQAKIRRDRYGEDVQQPQRHLNTGFNVFYGNALGAALAQKEQLSEDFGHE